MATISGFIAALLAAGIYGVVAVVANYSVPFLVLGLGAFIGLTVQYLGRGIGSRFVLLASILSIGACLLGYYFTDVFSAARYYGDSVSEIAARVSFKSFIDFTVSKFKIGDMFFWLLAVSAAAYFAKRSLSHKDSLAIHTYENRPKNDAGTM